VGWRRSQLLQAFGYGQQRTTSSDAPTTATDAGVTSGVTHRIIAMKHPAIFRIFDIIRRLLSSGALRTDRSER
jgi:hypothetical protein